MREGDYKDGKKHGLWKIYHKNGALKSEATFHEGKYTGYYCAYHDNGQKFREGHYADIQGNSRDGAKKEHGRSTSETERPKCASCTTAGASKSASSSSKRAAAKTNRRP